MLPVWQEQLQAWAADGSLASAARHALELGAHDPPLLSELVSQWAEGDFSGLPPIVLLPASSMPGAAGAYAISTGSIYLNQDWLETASNEQVIAVLTEEVGHHLDGLLNSADTHGDEGQVFAALLGNADTLQETYSQSFEIIDAVTIRLGNTIHSAEASAADIQIPSIQGFALDATTLNPAQPGGAFLSATLNFTDDLSGFDYGWVSFTSQSGQDISLSFNDGKLTGSRLTGSVRATQQLDPFSENGIWQLQSIEFRDQADNGFYKYKGQSDWDTFLASNNITHTSFTVDYGSNPAPGTGPDSQAPSIQGFALDATTLNPAQPGGAFLSATLDFTDDLSGFDYGWVSFTSQSGQDISLSFNDGKLTGSRLTGSARATQQLDPFSENGIWQLQSIEFRDQADNGFYKYKGQSDWDTFLASNNITHTSFTVDYGSNPAPGTGPDSQAPSIQGFALDATTLNPAQPGGAFLSATLDFTDDLSGFDYGWVSFTSQSGQDISLSFNDGKLTGFKTYRLRASHAAARSILREWNLAIAIH